MAEWLGNGLQNHVQQFDSAWHLLIRLAGKIRPISLYFLCYRASMMVKIPYFCSLTF